MSVKIDKISIKYLLLFMGLFTPDYIIHIWPISRFFDAVKVCVFAYCIMHNLVKVSKYVYNNKTDGCNFLNCVFDMQIGKTEFLAAHKNNECDV